MLKYLAKPWDFSFSQDQHIKLLVHSANVYFKSLFHTKKTFLKIDDSICFRSSPVCSFAKANCLLVMKLNFTPNFIVQIIKWNGILSRLYHCIHLPFVFLQACTWGVAYEVSNSEIEGSLQYLHTREVLLGGYVIKKIQFFPKDKNQEPLLALVYIATSDNPMYLGPAADMDIATQITACRGSAGHNIEYLVRLAEFMRICCPEVEDKHLFSIEAAVLSISKLCDPTTRPDFSQPAPNWGWLHDGWGMGDGFRLNVVCFCFFLYIFQ